VKRAEGVCWIRILCCLLGLGLTWTSTRIGRKRSSRNRKVAQLCKEFEDLCRKELSMGPHKLRGTKRGSA
jgi:hypothetical protein